MGARPPRGCAAHLSLSVFRTGGRGRRNEGAVPARCPGTSSGGGDEPPTGGGEFPRPSSPPGYAEMPPTPARAVEPAGSLLSSPQSTMLPNRAAFLRRRLGLHAV